MRLICWLRRCEHSDQQEALGTRPSRVIASRVYKERLCDSHIGQYELDEFIVFVWDVLLIHRQMLEDLG